MILAVNIENKVLTIGCFDKERLVFTEQTSCDRGQTELDYLLLFRSVLSLHDLDADLLSGGIISSVVPSLTERILSACERLCGKHFLVVGPGVKTGLSILMDNPAQVGNDLAVCAVAAAEYYPVPLLVVMLGTANCFLVINEKKQYVGSVIMPGMEVALSGLRSQAAQLPEIAIERPKKLIGSNTVQSMKSGIFYGTAASIDGMIVRMEEELNKKLTVVMTGAYGEELLQCCRHQVFFEQDLLLMGLRLIYEKNQSHKM